MLIERAHGSFLSAFIQQEAKASSVQLKTIKGAVASYQHDGSDTTKD